MEEFYNNSPFGKWLMDRKESAVEFSRRTFIAVPTVYKAIKGVPIRCSTVKKILRFAKQLSEEDFPIYSRKFEEIVERNSEMP